MTNMPTKTPKTLRTPSDLGKVAVEKAIDVLNPLVADAIALWLKTKSYHWHIAGRHFRDYHLLLDKQAGEILISVDPLAERVRKLGGRTVTSIGMVGKTQSVMDVDEVSLSARDMLLDLMEENKRMATALRHAHGVCDEAGDVGSASILEDFLDQAEERTWFLFETTREQ